MFQSILLFRTAPYLTTGTAFIRISQPWNFAVAKKGAPERYELFIFIQGHTQGGKGLPDSSQPQIEIKNNKH
jgi:hypothetical protein